MRKENILLSILFVLAVTSFALPFLATNIQNSILQETEKSIEISSYKIDTEQEYTINDTDDLSIIYEIMTFGTKNIHNIEESANISPAELFILVSKEIELMQDLYVLPKTQFRLVDTPTLFIYTSQENGSVFVWEYCFLDDDSNVLKFLFHSNSGKILWLDYGIEDFGNLLGWVVKKYSPYTYDRNTFHYVGNVGSFPAEIRNDAQKIIKSQMRLYDTGYSTTVYEIYYER